MNVIFDRPGDNPIAALLDGDFLDVELGVFAVVAAPAPAPIPLPAAGWLLLSGVAAFGATKMQKTSQAVSKKEGR
ncbi:VPLPA-CTERM sorting domain-containing protein [Roseobacter sp.]|uniref:VPLPA-CTERM sorting domain-containing protein n=1 Tax=Roseobacter sp. TaxID=1907202 RepID=UPI002966B5AC|nr:VPLPA-CTERM sorting domain-containing protein [Roseobacter sp.]MDW3181522.1 VPLPA-CTERM sorting domain-containing protein [Roseobacter sp.]